MRILMRACVVLCLGGLVAFAATPSQARKAADPAKQYFRFELRGFPEGTQCNASNVLGKVNTGKRFGRPYVKVIGYAAQAHIFCDLPDGRRLVTDLNKTMLVNPAYFGAEMSVDTRGNAKGVVASNRGALKTRGFIRNSYRFEQQ